jgi:hypothetical protein
VASLVAGVVGRLLLVQMHELRGVTGYGVAKPELGHGTTTKMCLPFSVVQ